MQKVPNMYSYAKYRWGMETQLSLALLKLPVPARELALESCQRAEVWIKEMEKIQEAPEEYKYPWWVDNRRHGPY